MPFKIQVLRFIHRKIVEKYAFTVKYENNGKSFFKYGVFYSVQPTWEPENQTKTLKPGLKKYAVEANMFRLRSNNHKKKFPAS